MGEKPIVVVLELSRMDVERGVIESQDRDEALEAIITGNMRLLEKSNELDFDDCGRDPGPCAIARALSQLQSSVAPRRMVMV